MLLFAASSYFFTICFFSTFLSYFTQTRTCSNNTFFFDQRNYISSFDFFVSFIYLWKDFTLHTIIKLICWCFFLFFCGSASDGICGESNEFLKWPQLCSKLKMYSFITGFNSLCFIRQKTEDLILVFKTIGAVSLVPTHRVENSENRFSFSFHFQFMLQWSLLNKVWGNLRFVKIKLDCFQPTGINFLLETPWSVCEIIIIIEFLTFL